MIRALVGGVTIALLSVGPAVAQEAGDAPLRADLGVEPRSVTVGEHFRSAVRVVAPESVRVEYGEFVTTDSLQAVAPVALTAAEDGGEAAIYTLVAWATGDELEASVPIRLVRPDGSIEERTIALALPEVVSVLPPPDQPVEPRPAKGLVVRPESMGIPWWWLLVLLAALAAAYWAYRRLRREGDELDEITDPRAWAKSQLSALQVREGMTAEELAEIYRRSSWVLRGYLAMVDPRLGPDLATGELEDRMLDVGIDPGAIGAATALLQAADLVKFAGERADVAAALSHVTATGEWIATYPPEPREETAERRVA